MKKSHHEHAKHHMKEAEKKHKEGAHHMAKAKHHMEKAKKEKKHGLAKMPRMK